MSLIGVALLKKWLVMSEQEGADVMNYKELCTEDKIAAIMEETRCWRNDGLRAIAEQYIDALKTNNHAAIEEFESAGDTPRHIIENKAHFARAYSVFGFTDTILNEYGWAEHEAFLDCETFTFGCGIKATLMGNNSITIGMGPNGKWTYGLTLAVSETGRCWGLSIFCKPHASRRECLRHGLEAVITWHTKANDKKTAPVIREAKEMLDDIMGRKQKQLSLFG